jgi:hypothetical protein
MRKLLALAVSISLVGCSSAKLTPNEMRVEEQILGDRFQEWVTALNNQAYASLDSIYMHTDDVDVIWADGTRARGWDDQETAIRNFYQTVTYMNFGPQTPDIRVLNANYATITYRHSTTTDHRMTGRAVHAGFGMMLWQRDPVDGRWKILKSIMSRNPPPQ